MQSLIKCTIACMLLIIAGCIKKEALPVAPTDGSAASLRELLTNNFSFSMFYEAMRKTGTDTLLDNETNGYTLFVPDNGAFSRSGITSDSLRKIDPDQLRKIVLYHVLPGKVSSAAIPQSLNFSFATLGNDLLYTSTSAVDTNLYVNGIYVIKKNIRCRNGFIHAMDQVLRVPASSVQEILANDPDYSCLVAGFKKFGLWDELKTRKPLVILAPTDNAFASYNWDLAAVNAMNAAEFKKFVFGSYILSPAFFFFHDVRMAPPKGPFLQEEVLLSFQGSSSGDGIGIKVLPLNYRDQEYGSRNIFYGDWVSFPFNQVSRLAINGIVHQANQLGVIPDSARIK